MKDIYMLIDMLRSKLEGSLEQEKEVIISTCSKTTNCNNVILIDSFILGEEEEGFTLAIYSNWYELSIDFDSIVYFEQDFEQCYDSFLLGEQDDGVYLSFIHQ